MNYSKNEISLNITLGIMLQFIENNRKGDTYEFSHEAI